jgi:lipid-A-disaccharide synthase
MYKIFLSAGEASGDLNGASVATALKTACPDARLFGMGGDMMRAAGVEIIHDIADLGVMGLVEIVKSLPKLFRLRDSLVDWMARERPDVLVVIDYPGFNTRLAKAAKKLGIPVISYISPSAWAWGRGRAREVAATVTKVAAIFPFEADVYRQAGADVVFVGHPLLDIVKPTLAQEAAHQLFGSQADKPVVLLMPGSRRQEIESLMPVMAAAMEKVAASVPDCQFFLPVASTISQETLQNMLTGYNIKINLVTGNTYDLMNIGTVAVAASGTATLEAAILGLPTVIVYKMAAVTYLLGKLLVKIPDIGLPNIVAGRRIVPELVQDDANPDRIARETLAVLTDPAVRDRVVADLLEVRQRLGECGAVGRVAEVILTVAANGHGGAA